MEPREAYASLERSRILKRVDAEPVWSVTCFFVAKPYRQRGMTAQLLRAVIDYAGAQGAGLIEWYPIAPKTEWRGGRHPRRTSDPSRVSP